MMRSIILLLGLILLPSLLLAQSKPNGIIQGKILETQNKTPVEYANVALVDTLNGKIISGAVTDSTGSFRLTNIPNGIYFLDYSFIGYEKKRSKPIGIDRKHSRADVGELGLTPSAVNMKEVTVNADKSMIINRIDRKIFNVQQDIMAQTGTVTDVLQNIPAVTVDMDGNISLRGSGNVTILVNGRPSAMAGTASLDQMPASLVERIEVITNPSAKYRPDGTAGIINIVLKKNRKAGFNGSLGGNIGNNDRYTTNLQLNLNTGKFNIYGSYGFRKDYRWRSGDLNSQTIDTATQQTTYLYQHSEGYSRPVSNLATLGVDWSISDKDVTGISGTLNYRDFSRKSTAYNQYQNDSLHPIEEFTRYQEGPDYETSVGANAYYEHTFNSKDEYKLRADFVFQYGDEHENYTYTSVYTLPLYPNSRDFNYNHILDKKLNLALTYSRPLWKNASLEAGYDGNMEISDQDFLVQHYDNEQGSWVTDSILTNHYTGNQTVHALFGTLSYTIKKFSFMAGIRPELALLNLDFITQDTSIRQTYFAVYPTLHLSLASGKNEWQLNYSRRVNRPQPEDMNPVPEYRDPRNFFVGNPNLKPEDIHSFEFGYAVKSEHISLIPTIFYRYRLNGFTSVTYNKNDSVLVTTMENLAHDQSAGIDFSGNAQIVKILNLNFSASGYYNEIDASNIGYSSNKAALSWNAKMNAAIAITKSTILQVNGQYRSSVLTPQGMRYPTWVVNLGFRQDFFKKKLSVLITVSDLFNSSTSKSIVNTPVLVQESLRRRDGPVIYGGLVFNFSTTTKKEKDIKFEFDNSMER
ncbi:MAG: TonB-dependent receptor [Bacteroidetes bacterium]|nr:TonB-dependent receptor [Bacteroidota bacterium]